MPAALLNWGYIKCRNRIVYPHKQRLRLLEFFGNSQKHFCKNMRKKNRKMHNIFQLLVSKTTDVDIVQFIHQNPACLSAIDKNQYNVLQIAMIRYRYAMIPHLLQLCPSLTANRDGLGGSALYMAVAHKRIDVIVQLIHVDPRQINVPSGSYLYATPFQLAVSSGNLEIVKWMTDWNPKVMDQLDLNKRSILHFASDPDVVEYLLSRKPTLIEALDENQDTPLHSQLYLPDARIDVKTTQLLLQKKPSLLYAKNRKGQIALEIARHVECHSVIGAYIRFDPDLQYYDHGHDAHKYTVLHLLAWSQNDDFDLIAYMTRTRQSELLVRNIHDHTPLDVAILRKNEHATHHFRLHCSFEDSVASYRKYMPSMNVDAWALEQCSVLNDVLLTDLVFLLFDYLGICRTRSRT